MPGCCSAPKGAALHKLRPASGTLNRLISWCFSVPAGFCWATQALYMSTSAPFQAKAAVKAPPPGRPLARPTTTPTDAVRVLGVLWGAEQGTQACTIATNAALGRSASTPYPVSTVPAVCVVGANYTRPAKGPVSPVFPGALSAAAPPVGAISGILCWCEIAPYWPDWRTNRPSLGKGT